MSNAELHPDGPRLTRRRLTQATAAAGGLSIAGASAPFVVSLALSERARAQGAPVEADVSRIGPTELATFDWPSFVMVSKADCLGAPGARYCWN